jgi:outer membrane lipoprotein-sorting protein
MSLLPHVKTRLLCAAALLCVCAARAEDVPDAKEILKTGRLAQTGQDRTLTGVLRTEGKKVPFHLTVKDNAVRWEFSNPSQALVLRLGESGSQFEEIAGDGKRKVTAARLDERVRGSEITYADLAMEYLYWPGAAVEGEQTILTMKCWQVLCVPPAKSSSPYGKVRIWVEKNSGALLKAEMFSQGDNDKPVRSFLAMSVQKTEDGQRLLKSMRILAKGARSPSYIDIDKPN